MELLAWLEATSLAVWVRESGSLWAYPLVITLHTVGLSILVGGSVAIDLRLLGAAESLPVAPLARLFPLLWTGFVINATTGAMLFMAAATTKAFETIFWIKLACIALGVASVYLLQTRAFGDVSVLRGDVTPRAKLLAIVSLVVWTGAIVAGRLMAYPTLL
jgi:hypothetical protein